MSPHFRVSKQPVDLSFAGLRLGLVLGIIPFEQMTQCQTGSAQDLMHNYHCCSLHFNAFPLSCRVICSKERKKSTGQLTKEKSLTTFLIEHDWKEILFPLMKVFVVDHCQRGKHASI